MEWLVTHMWMALGAMGLFGILLGWAVRGIMVMGKLHRAIGDKEIATAEVIEARSELDDLLKAQRGEIPLQAHSSAGDVDQALKKKLKDSEKRLADLTVELDAVKSSKSRGAVAAAVGGAVVGAGATVLAGKDEAESPSLAWRNRHLEARLTELEGQIETLNAVADTPALAAIPVVADADAQSGDEKVAADKAAWQVNYLNQRIAALEDELLAAPAASIVATEIEGDASSAVVGLAAAPSGDEPSDVDEELARLRWRNRYLEGRLAYFDGEGKAEEDEDGNGAGVLAVAGAATAALAATVLTRDDDDLEAEDVENAEIYVEDVPDSVEAVQEAIEAVSDEIAAEEEGSVSDAILKSLTEVDEAADAEADELPEANFDYSGVQTENETDAATPEDGDDNSNVSSEGLALTQPLALDSPVGGQADDLTVIGGVGPKIQEVLNGLGVYHYDQIAAWTLENVAWIDEHLSFSGRIDREGWVEQARILAGDD